MRPIEQPITKNNYKSVLCTNYLGRNYAPYDKVANISIDTKLYDLSYIVYSKEFAERFGYPEKNVYTLDKHIQVMELRLATEGGIHRCYLNILVDKNIGLDVPELSYSRGVRLSFPDQLKQFDQLNKEDQEYRLKTIYEPLGDSWANYYNRNFGLFTLDYNRISSDKSIGGGTLGLIVKEYSKEYYRDYDYFSIDIGCNLLTRKILKQKNASIWIKKKGGHNYSTDRQTAISSEFEKYLIPQKLLVKIFPIMEETDTYVFFQTIISYQKDQKKQGGQTNVNN